MSKRERDKTEPPILAFDSSVHAVPPNVAVEFLKKTMPFKELDDNILLSLAKHCRIDFFPKGTRLLTYNESEITHLYLIQRGGVKAFITDEEDRVVLKDYRGVGANIGALGLIRGTRANLNIETVEDTFCFLLERDIFLKLVQENSVVAHFYLKSFSDNVVATAYSELRRNRMTRRTTDALYLFRVTAGELTKTLHAISDTTSIQEAAAIMSEHTIGSLLVYGNENPDSIVGIITDTDFRTKVIAAGLDYKEPVTTIMSRPLKTVQSQTLCFDILLKMMSTGIHHLGVEQRGRVIGVVTSHDVMIQQGNSPYYLFKEIVAQPDFQGLYPLGLKISGIIRNIINEGAKAGNITRMIAILNDQIVNRILGLLQEQMGPPPVKFCWLLMGSEGRREQTFKTDQDNALIYADPENDEQRQRAEDYFSAFAKQAINHLVHCGYPLCKGDIMARNPKWCQPLSVWKSYFLHWINAPDPEELLNSTIFFDFRYSFGTEQLAVDLREYLIEQSNKKPILTFHLARQCIDSRAPLSFFNNFVVEKNGDHRDKLDIKTRGLTPFVNFARTLSLKYGIRETNTLTRLKILMTEEKIPLDLYQATVDAYEFQMQLRLIRQLSQIENGDVPDNFIHPEQLTDIEKRMLRDAFTVIERTQSFLENIFPAA